jgi:hypothetical protein
MTDKVNKVCEFRGLAVLIEVFEYHHVVLKLPYCVASCWLLALILWTLITRFLVNIIYNFHYRVWECSTRDNVNSTRNNVNAIRNDVNSTRDNVNLAYK